MEYMILIHGDETRAPRGSDAGTDEMLQRFLAYNQILIDGGHWISGGSLQPTSTSTTLRRRDGVTEIVDGPFAETKEQLGGYYVISAADLDEALALAKQIPSEWEGSIELRPLAFRPDAG
jgi:hypothetical protein